jgi:hypothetical protein
MIDPAALVDNLVALLRDIPDLVTEMGGDPERIYAYHDQYPKRASLTHALHSMPSPSMMAAWNGTSPGSFGGVDVWKHQVTVYMRARETFDGDPPTAYYRLFRLLTKGVPAGTGVEMLNATVHPSCHPMDLPLIQRQADVEGLDYFEVPITFTEIGDD